MSQLAYLLPIGLSLDGLRTRMITLLLLHRYELTLHKIQMKEKLLSLQLNLNKYSLVFISVLVSPTQQEVTQ